MCRRGVALLGLGVLLLGGCLTGHAVPSASWLPRAGPVAGADVPDVVQLDVFLVEGDLADRFLDREVWSLADDQVIPLEQKGLLDQNGFRVGQVGGVAPAALQAVLGSKRTCPDPRRILQPAGQPARLSAGPALDRAAFRVFLDDRAAPVELEQADCALVAVPSPAGDGRTRLHFTPEVRHGRAAVVPGPTLDRTAWMVHTEQPTEAYPALGWELTLGPQEYVVVGGRVDRPDTLGYRSFIRPQEDPPRQRLLVLRTARPAPRAGPDAPAAEDPSARRLSPPLALQAAWSAARGAAP
jgi:hypothetical protein